MKKWIIALVLGLTLQAHALEPASFDLVLQAGEDYALTLGFADKGGKAINLAGYAFEAQARGDYSAPAFAVFSTAISGPTVTLKMSRARSASLSGKRGVWDLMQTDPNGKRSYQLRGKILVVPVVTR